MIVNETRLTEFEKYIKDAGRSALINEFLDKVLTIREVAGDGSRVEILAADLAELIGKFSPVDRDVINQYLSAIGDHRRI